MSFVTTPAVTSEDGWRNLADYINPTGVTTLATGNYYIQGAVQIPTTAYLTFATNAIVVIQGRGGVSTSGWATLQRNSNSGTTNCLVYYGVRCTVTWKSVYIANYQTSNTYIVSNIASSASFGGDVTYEDCLLYRSGGSCIARFQGKLNNFSFVRTTFETPNTTSTSAMFRFDHDYGKMWFDGCRIKSGGNCSIFHKVSQGFDVLKVKNCYIYMTDNNGADSQKKLLYIQGYPSHIWEMEFTNNQLDGLSTTPLYATSAGTWERCLFIGNVDLSGYFGQYPFTYGYQRDGEPMTSNDNIPFIRGGNTGYL